MRLAILERQARLCACGCGARLVYTRIMHCGGTIRWDHRPPLRLRRLTLDGLAYDPDQLDPKYIDALTPDCHDRRTHKGRSGATSLGSDAHAIAKDKRLTGLGKPRRTKKIVSKGFDKTLSKKMSGRVTPRRL